MKQSNIIFRLSEEEHEVIKLKSAILNLKKSDYLRYSSLSFWKDKKDTSDFKKLTKLYHEGDEGLKKNIVNLLFQYYRRTGFPYFELNNEEKEESLQRIMNTPSVLLEDNYLQSNIVGLDLANCFHPHMLEVHYSNTKTRSPIEMFNDDDSLKDCINRWLELDKTVNPSGLRRILKTRDGARSVVNFKPAIAKYIYDTYCPIKGKALDPCSGYSGRLLGAISSNRNVHYTGIDPDGRTGLGNMECASFFNSLYFNDISGVKERKYKFSFSFHLGCAEDVMKELKEDSYDLIFTSPPYYDIEQYSLEDNQSYKKFNSYEKWLEGFLFVVVSESKRVLNKGGYFIINVKNCGDYKIADDLVNCCRDKYNLIKTYRMKMANLEYNRNKEDEKNFHSEPIFIFRKK